MDDFRDLPLFHGPHVAQERFERALHRLDLGLALADCPEPWREAIIAMQRAMGHGGPEGANLAALVRAHGKDWPPEIERTWQRIVGLRLDARTVPGMLNGEPAASFLSRGGEPDRAARSLLRHLEHEPTDARAWRQAITVLGVVAAARHAFHGGRVLPETEHLAALIEEDGHLTVEPWILAYAWLTGEAGLPDLERALAAIGLSRPLPLPGDALAFTWYVVEALRVRAEGDDLSLSNVEARRRLRAVSAPAFRRFLARVTG